MVTLQPTRPVGDKKRMIFSDFFRKISSVLFFAIKKCFRDVYIYCNTKNGRIKMKSNFNAAVFALFLHSSKNDLLFKTACFKKVFVEM